MKKILLLLINWFLVISLSAVSYTAKKEDIFSGNYGFITVGNTNHQLAGKDPGYIPIDKDEEIGEIEAIIDGTVYKNLAKSNVINSNSAIFMIATPQEATCDGKLSIKKAYLSWGGRSNSSDRSTVHVKVASVNDKEFLGERDFTGVDKEFPLYQYDMDMYLCHADTSEITDFINKAYTSSRDSVFVISVANLQTNYKDPNASSDNQSTSIGQFSGWTLTIIYEHTGLPEKTIMYYAPDILGDVVGPSFPSGRPPLLFDMDLTDVKKNLNLSEPPTIAISSLGGYRTESGDMMVGNKNGHIDNNDLKGEDPILAHKGRGNVFNCSAEYEYKYFKDKVGSDAQYKRGYDLHVFATDPSNCVPKDQNSFNFAVTLEPEVHLVSDIVLMFGEPNVPEIVLKDETIPTAPSPGTEVTYTMYVSLGKNSEPFQDFELNIPFTDYVESVSGIKMTFAKDTTGNNDWEPKPFPNKQQYVKFVYGLSENPVEDRPGSWSGWSNLTTNSGFLKDLNNKMKEADVKNYEQFLANPLNMKQRILQIKVDSIGNIGAIKSDEAIKIEIKMKTKPKGDWAYDKNTLKGGNTSYVSQSELTFTTPSGRSSVLESIDKTDYFNWRNYICDQRGRGDGAGGGGGAGGGDCGEKSSYGGTNAPTASKKGVYTKDPRHVSIEITEQGECPQIKLPDSLFYSFCGEGVEITSATIRHMLASKYKFDLDSIVERDSLTWIDVKQDSIYMIARRHGVNRSEVEGLIDFSSVSAKTKTRDTIIALAGCADPNNLDVFGDSIDAVLNSPMDLSDMFLLFEDESLTGTYDTPEKISIRKDEHTYFFDKSGKFYIQFYSPWKNRTCSDLIPVVVEKFETKLPKVFYAGTEISKDTTIFVCNEAEIENIKIEKAKRTYDIYRNISGKISKPDSAINVNADKIFNWDANRDIVDRTVAGDYKIKLWTQDLDCTSDTFEFTINVTDIAIKDHPVFKDDDTTVCRIPNDKDGIELSIKSGYNPKMTPVWYIEDQVDSFRTVLKIGDDNINVPIDSAGRFIYSVAYKSGECISDLRDSAYVDVLELPDTLATDTIYFCANYEVKRSDISNWLVPKIVDSAHDSLRYYKRLLAAEEDSVPLADLISEKFFKTDCTNSSSDFVETSFFVRVKNSCFSAPSRMLVRARCYDTDAPKFAEGVDSVLYCIGDVVASDLNVFIDAAEKSKYSDGYRWQWITSSATSLPEFDNATDFYSNVAATYGSRLDGKDQDRELFSVVRIDSNNCVSKADTFQVIVDENITTFPFVGDTTKTIVKNTDPLTIRTCQNTPFYESATIPTKPTSEDYTIEWFEKTDDVIGAKDTVFLHEVFGKYDVVGMRQYKIRQSTKLGCKGAWLDVNLLVNPEVKDVPEFDRINLCSGDKEVKVVNKNTLPADLTLNYYSFKDTLKASPLSNVSIGSDSIGEFVQKNSLYTAAYRDVTTGCEGSLVDVEAVVSDLPHLPLLDNDTVSLCLGAQTYDLVEATGAAVNVLDNNTKLYWSALTGVNVDEDGIATITSAKKNIRYFVKQKNELTGCVGKDTTVVVNIDKTFSFKRQKDTVRCYGESFDLLKSLNDSLRIKNDIIDAKVSFKVYKLTGETPSATPLSDAALSAIKSDAGRHEDQSKRFLVQYEDEIGGCSAKDTVTLLFRGLPSIMELSNIDTCFALPFNLPSLDDNYEYQWYRNDLETMITEKKVALEESEKLYLIAKNDKECADTASIEVTIHKNPIESLVKDTVFCQNTGEHVFDIKAQSSDENEESNLNTVLYDAAGNEVPRSINTDTVAVDGKRKVLDYVVVQENFTTHCTSKTDFHVEVRKAFTLKAEDTKAVCEPDSVDLAKHVKLYLSGNESSIGIVDLATLNVKFGRIDGNNVVDVNDDAASVVKHIAGRDTVNYTYIISDAENVCSASDTVAVTINFKPTAPKIADSQDTAFLCSNNVDLKLSAVDTNKDKTNTSVFWGEYKNGVEGNDLTVAASASNVIYTAFTKNLKSGCVSDYDTTFAVVAEPVKVDVIEDSVSKKCAGEKINVYDALVNSFHFDPSIKRSFIKYEMTQNGVAASKSELSSVSRTVQDTIVFEMTATDTLTGCTASNSVTVIFHNRPQNKIVAPSIACVGNTFEANTEGEDRKSSYSWQNKDGFELSSIASVKINALAYDTTLFLITNIDGTGCSDTLEHQVTVYATPDRLDAQETFRFCQTDDDVKIEIARKDEDVAAYKLEWTSAVDSVVVDPFVASAKKDTAYKLTVKQINITADTVCKSEPIVVDVEITKHISIALADTAICQPLEFDLAKYAQTKKTVSDDGYKPELTSVKIYDGGVTKPVSDSTAVTEPGLYELVYTDKYGCPIESSVKLAFISKPTKPELDTDSIFNLCQMNDTVVTPAVVAGNYEFVWKNVGADKTFAAESLAIDASKPVDNVVYKVVRRDTIYGCESDPQSLTYSVKAPFAFDDLADVDICEYETINLDSLARKHLRPLDNLVLDIHNDGMNGNISSINVEKVALEGVYVVDVKDTVSTCVASKSLTVKSHKKPAISVSGNRPICEGNDLLLTADGADYFYWNETTVPSTAYKVVSTNDDDITVSLLARSVVAENDKTCEMDTSFVVKVHTTPSVLPSQDLFRFCQTDDDVNIELTREDADASVYKLEWTSAVDSVVADKFVASARKDTAYELSVRQLNINVDTVCKSDPIKVKIEFTKAISIALADTAICMPLEFDLAQFAQTKKVVSDEGFMPQLTSVKLYEGGVEKGVADSTKVTVAGNYKLVYTDRFNCPIAASTNLKFIKKPETPVLDVDPSFNLCVGVETTVHADVVAGDYKTSWTMVGNGAESFGDTLGLDVAKPIKDGYDVYRIDTVYGCESEKTHFDYNVIEPFRLAENRNLDICEYETIDLDSVSRAMYPDTDLKLELVPTMALDATMPFVASKASAEGVYLLNVVHQISNCEAQSEIKINNYKKPEITVVGNKPICKGDTLLLKVNGGDFYYWNNSNVSVDSAFVPGLADGETLVNLSVSKLVGASGKTCKADSVVAVIVEKVPDLITSKLDTAYCQDGKTGALYLDPTDDAAKVVWYSPEDSYETARPNASFAPSAVDAGEFTFKVKQILGNCSTKLQDYVVTIENKITDTPVVTDTAYCVGETPVELIAHWKDYACGVKWTDKNQNDVDLLPSTTVSGQTQYCARLTRGACVGQPVCMTVYVKDRFDTKVDIQDTFRFCAKTGVHRLEPNTTIPGVRLNWYNIHDVKRADYAEFDADGNQNSDTYYVTQSEINGCESDSVKVEVVKVPAVLEQDFSVDTCKGVRLTAADVMAENKIDYEMKSLAKVAADGNDSIIPLAGNIGFDGVYKLTVATEYGCVGVEKINVKMIEPEHLTWPVDGFTSCPGDTVSITAGSANSWFKVLDSDGETELAYLYGVNDAYSFVADEYKQFEIVAMVKGHETCTASKTLSYNVYSPEQPVVFGTPGVCKGDELKLSVGNIEKNFSWVYDGEVLSTTDEFRYTPEKGGYLRVSGTDKNGCAVSDTVSIKVVDILTPKIELHPRISSTQYHINRDTTEVDFEAKLNTVDDGMFSYSWDFGDASVPGISKFENHVYSDTVVKLARLVNVGLTVTHEFGCVGTAYATLYIDPSINVPNTFVIGTDNVFMENYDLEIFDRVGNLIHEGLGWDGTYDKNGDLVFHDTYFYSLTYYVGGEEQHKTGYITVVR
ncbi:MAG: gliding motility-associated C-terminal domain-containing protein [Bacteroidales bacterium]|nr:gliding motility-associated C-terminal domain-containing protein [Candidatus Scybalocola fimicaballi]